MLKPAGDLPDWDDRPLFSNWEGCVVLDPAETAYHNFLVQQAKLHVEQIPASSGICIDRLDWMRYYNQNGDDSISMVGQQKTRSLLTSWKNVITPVAQIMHAANKVIFCNPLYRRIDLLQHLDGIYDEFGYMPYSINLCAQMAFFKPVIAWTASKQDLMPDADAFFQHYIYLGAFLTVPYPGNDHCITPDAEAEKYYADYGMFFKALQGREWLLMPHVVEVIGNAAKANIFKTGNKLIIPLMLAGHAKLVGIKLRLPATGLTSNKLKIEILHPGKNRWEVLKVLKNGKEINLNVPLERGCALLRVS